MMYVVLRDSYVDFDFYPVRILNPIWNWLFHHSSTDKKTTTYSSMEWQLAISFLLSILATIAAFLYPCVHCKKQQKNDQEKPLLMTQNT